ncbi:hypothetical protein J3R30DRAFT_1807771 [Lentinula aciculospora]|uniref:Peptidase A1 domain-containing protein n=1 Tax=Lentinula aciculospora TaxID=153920 RepID=A0A9W9DTH3_9AGAR|nr:hypothetical protein J3R30DRAFT_1807771 [Lentinula aciculospora]
MTSTPDTAVPRLVVVDDTDPLIQYSPSSAFSLDSEGKLDGQGYGGPVFNHTLTGTTTNGSFTYNFKGTFVRAMLAAEGLYGWNCTVDNHVITSFDVDTPQVTNYIACDSAGTLAGSTNEHALGVNFFFFPDSPSNSSIWLDSIQYQPLPSDPLDALTLRIHNSDPSVTYSNSSGGWSFQGINSNATDITGTSMGLAFNGTSASLYSVNFGDPAQFNASTAFYTVDGDSTDFDLPGSAKTANSRGNFTNISNWPLFTTPDLSATQHNLNVATSYNSSTEPQYLAIEYFIIQTNPANSSSTEGSSNSTGVGSTPAASLDDHKPAVGAIVGGILGGIVGLAVLVLGLFLFRRRRKNGQYRFTGMLDLSDGASPDHFGSDSAGIISSKPSAMQSVSSSHHLTSGGTFTDTPHRFPTSSRHDSPSSENITETTGGFNSNRLVSMKNAQRLEVREEQLRRAEVRMHTDSGVRLPSEIHDVPPTYTEY